ncbi:hypothetical protein CUMW_120180 [Citrus unshiu]|uniref:ABC1 atypical kinase-like domain-containing protein n=1 Tax=Citrus unshiu TaxID=55188 RepID=A0A2H5PB31_CITUN|nr:hypothetical protein CUMW_120180 [Citrus unshiu]
MSISLASASTSITALRSIRTTPKRSKRSRQARVIGDFSHFGDAVRKDMEFLKKRIGKGIGWANQTFRLPQVSKTLDDVLWLRNLEDPRAAELEPCDWPQPSYPGLIWLILIGLTGADLLMADLKALEAYANYFYHMLKIWSKPLPEVYNPQDVADYFNCRPHIVGLRLLELQDYQYASYMPLLADAVGQSLSTRPDIIGSDISKALSELHDQIPPFPRSIAMKIIEEELGSPVESFFSFISEEPVAAASFGQVYHGSTLDGSIVAVKVQRPNLRHVVVRDIYILRIGLGLLQKIAKRKSDLRLYADELGKGLVGELDYTLEAANASEFQESHSPFPFIHVPKVFRYLSRKRVLTMEWMVGESPTDLISLSTGSSVDGSSTHLDRQKLDAKWRLLDLVNKGVEATLVQLLETGILHADPHPGNLRYTSSGQIGFLDFGLLCRMERKHQFAMLASIVHIVNGDWQSLVHSLTEMDVVRPGTNTLRVTMDLEDALGEVEFKDGIPDVKFSRVLGKIWSIALKYHFRMPPYYTLVLRSLASLEGLAIAGDPHFKTFEAAYPFVIQKLLTENSVATRKILHSVVFNKKKEFQWQRLSLFLRVGATRKGLQQVIAPKTETTLDYLPNRVGVFDAANLVLRLLRTNDGVVLRRLLMTADGASLIRAFVSKEASFFRHELCRVIADALYQWMCEALGRGIPVTRSSQLRVAGGSDKRELEPSSGLSATIYDYQSFLKDRRLKVIFSKILDPVRRDPVLMLRLCWAAFVMLVKASALACQRMLVSLSEAYLGPVLAPKRFAISASNS